MALANAMLTNLWRHLHYTTACCMQTPGHSKEPHHFPLDANNPDVLAESPLTDAHKEPFCLALFLPPSSR